MRDFVMPSLGADMEAATLTEWFVKPEDAVQRGDVVASVETTKGIIDIEIFDDGIIDTLIAAPGDEVPVGGVLAKYRPTGATASTEPAAPAAARAAPAPLAALAPVVPPVPVATTETARRAVSPAARRRALQLGIDVTTIEPSTAGKPVSLADVERAAAHSAAPTTAAADMRAQIAQSMSRSKREIPHYYLATTIDMRNALRWLEAENAARPVTERLLYSALLLKATAKALEKFPELNGFWRTERYEPATAINVGTAIRLRQGGLVAPALMAANEQPLATLMRNFQALVQRARTGRLRAAELAGATITVSNLGEGSVETVYPIIYPPQVAIVGFGAIVIRPWCNDETVVAAPLVQATLAADHRVSDGHRGSAFLMKVADALQRPEEL